MGHAFSLAGKGEAPADQSLVAARSLLQDGDRKPKLKSSRIDGIMASTPDGLPPLPRISVATTGLSSVKGAPARIFCSTLNLTARLPARQVLSMRFTVFERSVRARCCLNPRAAGPRRFAVVAVETDPAACLPLQRSQSLIRQRLEVVKLVDALMIRPGGVGGCAPAQDRSQPCL